MRLRLIEVKIGLAPDLAELFQALLSHEDNNDLTFLLEDALEDLLVHLVDENLLIDVVLSLGGLAFRRLKYLLVHRV